MVHSERIVVVGGNAAGLSAASYVKRKRPEIEALIFSEISSRLIWLLRTAYYIEGLVKDPLELIAVPINALRGKRGLDVRVLHEVIGMDTDIFSYITSL